MHTLASQVDGEQDVEKHEMQQTDTSLSRQDLEDRNTDLPSRYDGLGGTQSTRDHAIFQAFEPSREELQQLAARLQESSNPSTTGERQLEWRQPRKPRDLGEHLTWISERARALSIWDRPTQTRPAPRDSNNAAPLPEREDFGEFLPSRLVLAQRQRQASVFQSNAPSSTVSNPNYRGEGAPGSNQDDNIPEEENCAIWITGIPADAGLEDVLSALRNTGRIYSSHLNPVDEHHDNAAAKIVFTTREGAVTALARATDSELGIRVLGSRVNIRPNRARHHAHTRTQQSRVIRVVGDARFVDAQKLRQFFEDRFQSDLISVDDQGSDRFGDNVLDFTFGSMYAQAINAVIALAKRPARDRGYFVRWEYLQDPCE